MKRVPVMENLLQQDVNVIRIIMENAVSIGMSVKKIVIVVRKESVLICREQHCQNNNVIVIWVGLDQDVIQVSFFFVHIEKFN